MLTKNIRFLISRTVIICIILLFSCVVIKAIFKYLWTLNRSLFLCNRPERLRETWLLFHSVCRGEQENVGLDPRAVIRFAFVEVKSCWPAPGSGMFYLDKSWSPVKLKLAHTFTFLTQAFQNSLKTFRKYSTGGE